MDAVSAFGGMQSHKIFKLLFFLDVGSVLSKRHYINKFNTARDEKEGLMHSIQHGKMTESENLTWKLCNSWEALHPTSLMISVSK